MSISQKILSQHSGLSQVPGSTFAQGNLNAWRAIASVGRQLLAHYRRRRTERQLESLSDAIMKDIGVSRSEVPFIAHSLAFGGDGRRRVRH